MNRTSPRIVALLILIFMAVMLMGCESLAAATPDFTATPGQASLIISIATPIPAINESPNPAYAIAQATLDAGNRQLSDLSHQSTAVSQNMAQAANAAALSTKDFNQRQKMALDYQATVVSLNIAQAAATQRFLLQQTKSANDAITAAQSSAATATQSAYLINATQMAQAQAVLDTQVMQTAQVAAAMTDYPLTATYSAYALNVTETVQAQLFINARTTQVALSMATLTAYPRTATPFALTKAALLMQQYGREQQSFVTKIVTPLLPVIAALDLILFVLVIIFAYRRFMVRPRRLSAARINDNPRPLIMIDGTIIDHDPQLRRIIPYELMPANPSGLPGDNTVRVEIVNATEPPVAHWIAEAERQLTTEGGLLL